MKTLTITECEGVINIETCSFTRLELIGIAEVVRVNNIISFSKTTTQTPTTETIKDSEANNE